MKQCKWTTKKGAQCKKSVFPGFRVCYLHIPLTYPKSSIITLLFSGAAILLTSFPLKCNNEESISVRAQAIANRVIKDNNEPTLTFASHQLLELGKASLDIGDYESYRNVFREMLRVCEHGWTKSWGKNPINTNIREDLIANQLVSLLLLDTLDWGNSLETSKLLSFFALAGTKDSVYDYNKGKLFSDVLFTETLETFKRVITELNSRNKVHFSDGYFEFMQNVFFAEAYRLADQGYRICWQPTDIRQEHFTGERVADVGQPEELNSYYKACRIMSRLPNLYYERLVDDSTKPYPIWISVARPATKKDKIFPMVEIIARFKYYRWALVIARSKDVEKDSIIADSLAVYHNKKSEEAAKCAKQLVMRERNPSTFPVQGLPFSKK